MIFNKITYYNIIPADEINIIHKKIANSNILYLSDFLMNRLSTSDYTITDSSILDLIRKFNLIYNFTLFSVSNQQQLKRIFDIYTIHSGIPIESRNIIINTYNTKCVLNYDVTSFNINNIYQYNIMDPNFIILNFSESDSNKETLFGYRYNILDIYNKKIIIDNLYRYQTVPSNRYGYLYNILNSQSYNGISVHIVDMSTLGIGEHGTISINKQENTILNYSFYIDTDKTSHILCNINSYRDKVYFYIDLLNIFPDATFDKILFCCDRTNITSSQFDLYDLVLYNKEIKHRIVSNYTNVQLIEILCNQNLYILYNKSNKIINKIMVTPRGKLIGNFIISGDHIYAFSKYENKIMRMALVNPPNKEYIKLKNGILIDNNTLICPLDIERTNIEGDLNIFILKALKKLLKNNITKNNIIDTIFGESIPDQTYVTDITCKLLVNHNDITIDTFDISINTKYKYIYNNNILDVDVYDIHIMFNKRPLIKNYKYISVIFN